MFLPFGFSVNSFCFSKYHEQGNMPLTGSPVKNPRIMSYTYLIKGPISSMRPSAKDQTITVAVPKQPVASCYSLQAIKINVCAAVKASLYLVQQIPGVPYHVK